MTHTRLAAIGLLLAASAAMAQSPAAIPRTRAGRPDLDGVWTNASLTRLSRPRNVESLVLSPEQARELEGSHFHNVRAAADILPLDPDRDAPEALERLPPVGNYNAAWVDPGSTYARVRGEIRSSWIIDPDTGQVPYRPETRERISERRVVRAALAGPEALSLGERCLLGFGGTAGPPMLNVLYNNFYRIVQTEDHVLILVEMVHDARVIRLDSDHGPTDVRRWLGDSIGHWEGDTLVVETMHFHPARVAEGALPYSSDARVVERFTGLADQSLLYEFTVEDPAHLSANVRGEMSFRNVDDRVYEYACHEGNYAMGNILRGARREERESVSEH